MSDADAPDYITADEAAAILDLSARQVNRYGKGDPPRLRTRRIGRRILYARADVLSLAYEYAMSRTPPPQKPATSPIPSSLLPPVDEHSDPLAEGEFISLREAAFLAGLSEHTLRNYAARGRLRAKKIGNVWLTTKAAVAEYLASRSK
jgi:excisionase family DNA binding protein